MAWAITSTMAIILLILKRYLLTTFCKCSCTPRNSSDTPVTSHEHIPLADVSTSSPIDAMPDMSHGLVQPTGAQPSQSTTPDASSNYSTPQSKVSPEMSSTPSSTKPLMLDAPAYNTRSKVKGKVLFK